MRPTTGATKEEDTMTREDVVALVDTYIAALKSGDYSSVPFAPMDGHAVIHPIPSKKYARSHNDWWFCAESGHCIGISRSEYSMTALTISSSA